MNKLIANIVSLEIGTGVWFATTVAYDHAKNGLMYIWNAKKGDFDDFRPCEIGTAQFCEETAARWNALRNHRTTA